MLKFLILLVLGQSLAFAGPREEAQDILLRFKNETSVTKRLDLISKTFVGLPYGQGGPLGEGPDGRYDQDPLYRFDTFDCTTYVETIMALALARDVDEFEVHLDKIRYENGDIDYLKRNHFTDLQWIPFNIQNGYMNEINSVVTKEIKIAEALINFPNWLRSIKITEIKMPYATEVEKLERLEELQREAQNYSTSVARVNYLEINMLVKKPQLLTKIPTGTIVNFVRPNWDLTDLIGTHQNISHQGFIFKRNNVVYLRHASTTGAVKEEPFLEYLKKFVNHKTMKGIHLMSLN